MGIPVRAKRRSLVAALLIAAAALMTQAMPAQPSEADPVGDAAFVQRTYDEFLGRDPTAGEVAWWVAYLDGGSRSVVLSSVFDSSEFVGRFFDGVHAKYLERLATSGEKSVAAAAVAGGSSHVSLEVPVLAGAEFYALAGSTDVGFIGRLYEQLLDRPADPAGEAYYLGKLANGYSRSWVASTLIRSSSAAGIRVRGDASATQCSATALVAPEDIFSGSYCLILNRMADPSGAAYWIGQMSGSGDLPDLWGSLASSNEFYTTS